MYAQIAWFDGPRSAEVVTANDTAGRHRLMPALAADAEVRASHRGTFVLRQPDGTELVLVLADDERAFDRGSQVILGTELLPGEDPALLTGPDRFTRYEVVAAYDADFRELVRA
ncbi:MAG: hypothetical protein ACTHMS_05055 [Jatrophihabitans sp.]|uniref:hypothetical protein n=1 Tax=Jatrophihabitans sp. TaxID=1932789 RepID=UPI003F7F9340